MSIKQKAQEVVEEFSMFEDWMDKYNYLIEMGKEMEPLEPGHKTPQYLISGCQSQLWLYPEFKDGRVYFKADSDAIITKGVAQLLLRVFNGATPQEILDDDLSFLNQIGLKEHLSPTRSNGLDAMVKQIKLYALVYKTKTQQS